MSHKIKDKKLSIILIVLFILLIILFCISMCVGRYEVSLNDVFLYFCGENISLVSQNVIKYLRLPRTLIAMLIGVALSVSGVIYQSTFNNKLVSPDLLGVSSGASVGACFAILLGLSSVYITIFSFIAGFVAVFITVVVAKSFNNKSNVILLLSGIAIGGLMSSLVGLMKYLADDEFKLAEMTFWLLGDISKSTIEDVYLMLPIVAIFSTLTIIFAWRLNIISLGDKESKSLGVNYVVTMLIMIISATILTASAVSISGTIGWVGLVIPNIVRLIIGSDNRKVLPVSILLGACFMVIVDMLARSLAPNEIPLGVITGILGTPLFIFAIFKRRKEIK